MKKLTLILSALFLTIGMYAATDIEVSFCDSKNSKKISRETLNSCNVLSLNTKDWKIKSFSIGFEVGGHYYESNNVEGSLSSESKAYFKKLSPTLIYVEKIILLNRSGEEKTLEPQKITITD